MNAQGRKRFTEEERLRAVRLVCQEGWRTKDVAEALGCSKRSIELWIAKSNRGRKPSELRTGKAPGATPKLNAKNKRRLLRLLQLGPEAAGFKTQLWNAPRIAKLIETEFGVSYNRRYIPQLLQSLGWSVQKPKSRAIERDEERIQQWVDRDWERIKKNRDD
jgi:putative transposase